MTPIEGERGSLTSSVHPVDFVSLFADFSDTALYTYPLAQPIEPIIDRGYTDNQDFWHDAIAGVHFDEMRVFLQNFHLLEWIPLSPGRYFTARAVASREGAQECIAPNGQEYLPKGKRQMVLGGIGSIRLGPKVIDSKPMHLLGASSTGISHQGIPIAMNRLQYRSVIKCIKKHGGCVVDLRGLLRLLPTSMSVVQYDREIPRFCFFTEDVNVVEPSLETELLASIAIMFPSIHSRNREELARGGYTTRLRKMWSFCSFNPSSTESGLRSAVSWLKDYATRHSKMDNPPILNDFDEYYQHFDNPIEFSLLQLFNSDLDLERLKAYKKHYGFTINIGDIILGDVFKNIRDSTIINRSIVEKSFNKVQNQFDRDTAMALLRVAEEIVRSGNKEAAELFIRFNEELQKPKPRQSMLRSIWNGIKKVLPTILQLTDVVMKISKLFGD